MDIVINVLEGVGSIIVASLLLLIPQVREFIIKSYQNSLDKALEDKKASNERKNYVSKVRFDKEFEIYQEISEKNLNLVFRCSDIAIAAIGGYEKEIVPQIEEDFFASLTSTKTTIRKYAPFIPEKIYLRCKELNGVIEEFAHEYRILKICKDNNYSEIKLNLSKYNNTTIPVYTLEENIKSGSNQISKQSEELNDLIREHLQNLEVKE